MRNNLLASVCIATGLCAFTLAGEDALKWQLDGYYAYFTGDYGARSDTDMSYVAVVPKRVFSWGEVSVTLPLLKISSPRGVVVVDGAAESVGDGSGDGGMETRSGIGDFIVKAEYALKEAEGKWPWVDAFAKLKLPTGDEDDGLGTGETDFGLGVEVLKLFPKNYLGFLDIGYTFIGDPSGMDYDNRWLFSPGIGRNVLPELMLAGFYELRTSIGPGDDAHSLSGLAYYTWRSNIKLYTMLDVGLSDGAADFGVTLGSKWRF